MAQSGWPPFLSRVMLPPVWEQKTGRESHRISHTNAVCWTVWICPRRGCTEPWQVLCTQSNLWEIHWSIHYSKSSESELHLLYAGTQLSFHHQSLWLQYKNCSFIKVFFLAQKQQEPILLAVAEEHKGWEWKIHSTSNLPGSKPVHCSWDSTIREDLWQRICQFGRRTTC